jgi:hypothetical protein
MPAWLRPESDDLAALTADDRALFERLAGVGGK